MCTHACLISGAHARLTNSSQELALPADSCPPLPSLPSFPFLFSSSPFSPSPLPFISLSCLFFSPFFFQNTIFPSPPASLPYLSLPFHPQINPTQPNPTQPNPIPSDPTQFKFQFIPAVLELAVTQQPKLISPRHRKTSTCLTETIHTLNPFGTTAAPS